MRTRTIVVMRSWLRGGGQQRQGYNCLYSSHWTMYYVSHHPTYNTDSDNYHRRIQTESNQFSVESYQSLSQHLKHTVHHRYKVVKGERYYYKYSVFISFYSISYCTCRWGGSLWGWEREWSWVECVWGNTTTTIIKQYPPRHYQCTTIYLIQSSYHRHQPFLIYP